MEKYTIKRSKMPDNTGGYDYCVSNEKHQIIAEFYGNIGYDENHNYVSSPAYDLALKFVKLLEAESN